MLKKTVIILGMSLWSMPVLAAKNDPFSVIQDPMAQAVIQQYMAILADNPKLQQQVMRCALDQIAQNPEAQKILTVDPAKLQNSVQQKKVDLKATLITVKAVFAPCLDMLNSNITIN